MIQLVQVVFCIMMRFDDAKQFEDAIVKYSITQRTNIQFTRNTKDYIRAKYAKENCPWKILVH